MFKKNNVKLEQTNLFSKTNEWSDYKLSRLKKGWAETFRATIMPNINEEPYRVLYSDMASRPNTPVNYMVGLLIIKSLMGLSDEELLDAALFNEQVQYALGTLDCVNQPISKNMVSNFRVRIYNYEEKTNINLFEDTMRELNDKIVEISNIDKSLKRVDSLMISSSCKRMTRTELIYKINERMIKLLDKLEENINEELKCYLDEDNSVDVLYRTKEEEIGGKLTMLLNHSLSLFNTYKDNDKVNQTEEFLQLKRLIEDQYNSDENKPKSGKDIKPTSMQTPYDDKATYRFKYKGNIGYVGNVVESIDTEKGLALITNWDVAQNIKSDIEFMEDIIAEKETSNKDNKELYITDAAYFSSEINVLAQEANIEMHPTDMTGKKDVKETNLSKFELDENNNIVKCPNGNTPIESKYSESKNMVYADFNKKDCSKCLQRDTCPIREFSLKNKLSTSVTQIELAKVRENRNTDEYKQISRLRSGIEGIPSILRRKYNIDNRQTKGLVYLDMVFSSSIVSINIKRITKYNRLLENNVLNSVLEKRISYLLISIFRKFILFSFLNS